MPYENAQKIILKCVSNLYSIKKTFVDNTSISTLHIQNTGHEKFYFIAFIFVW